MTKLFHLHTVGVLYDTFRLYVGSDLKTYLLMRWKDPDALAVCQAHQDLPVGFILLGYSVLLTVESLTWLISFLYLDLYVLDKVGVFMQTKYLCVLISF